MASTDPQPQRPWYLHRAIIYVGLFLVALAANRIGAFFFPDPDDWRRYIIVVPAALFAGVAMNTLVRRADKFKKDKES